MSEKTQEKPKKQRGYTAWKPIFLVQVYRYAKAGLSDAAVCKALGIGKNTMLLWKKKRPEVAEALALAREESPEDPGFVSYFYSQMDPRLQRLWDHLTENEQLGGGARHVRAIMAGHSRKSQQGLYLQALVGSHFSPTRAMEKVGLYKRRLEEWKEQDPDFAELLAEIDWHKGNFYEESLHRLIEKGDTTATIFANKTYNRGRGYGTQATLDVNVSGSVQHTHALDLDSLDLDLDTRSKILDAIRSKEERDERKRLIGQAPPGERLIRQVEDLVIEKGKEL